jgi:hypothetical protein
MKGFSQIWPNQNPEPSALTLNCVLYTSLRRTATNFSGIMPLTNLELKNELDQAARARLVDW